MTCWRLAPGVTRLRHQRLAGGSPYRIVRLSDEGARLLAALLGTSDSPRPASPVEQLAQRLVSAGILLGPAPAAITPEDITVVIPARSDDIAVSAVLRTIPHHTPVIVVDDGSTPALTVARADPGRLQVLRHDRSRGPGAARNAGAAVATTAWIAFIDSDVTPETDCLGALLAHESPDIVALAPRIVSGPGRGLGALVETWSGALDRGSTPNDVGPGRLVSFVPTAMLLVRRETFVAVGGFAEELQVGEDVDLVWRLADVGRVRYEPDVVCVHRPRPSLRSVLTRRFDYGGSAAALDRRRPGSVRHVDVSVWSLAPWGVAVGIRWGAGLALAGAGVLISPRGLRQLPAGDAMRLAARGHALAAAGLGRYLVRPMWPITLVALTCWPRRRKALAAAVLVGTADHLRRWITVERGAGSEATRPGDLAGLLAAAGRVALASLLDDGAYSAGVWAGCWRERTLGPLIPRVRDLPGLGRQGQGTR